MEEAVRHLPVIPKEYQKEFKIIRQRKPKEEEKEINHRARSSKLRVIERVTK